MLAKISIEAMRLKAVIGTNDWERTKFQDVIVTIQFMTDISKAAASDNFMEAVDYEAMQKRVTEFVEGSSCFLIEKLAADILGLVVSTDGVESARVKLDKPGALHFCQTVSIDLASANFPA